MHAKGEVSNMGKNAFKVREKKTLDTHSQTENNWESGKYFRSLC